MLNRYINLYLDNNVLKNTLKYALCNNRFIHIVKLNRFITVYHHINREQQNNIKYR